MDRMTQDQLNEQLLQAVKDNDIEAIKKAIEDGADVNTKDKDGKTPLRWTFRGGHTETAELLKQYGGVE